MIKQWDTFHKKFEIGKLSPVSYIYNGILFPSLNYAILGGGGFFFRWTTVNK